MIKFVSYILMLCSLPVYGLVPVEGILMGTANENIQTDPLQSIFSDIYDTSQFGANKKLKLYHSTYTTGEALKESCSYLGAPVYSADWQEKQARRSVAATLQYIGLDTTIKALGAYAKKLDIPEEDFRRLTKNLVTNYCSQNITVFSLKNIYKSILHYYRNPSDQAVPSVASLPFAPEQLKMSTEKSSARSREFDLAIKNFKAFCSWGGEVEDYRLLTPYLNNSFIMAFVFKNMSGLKDFIEMKEKKVVTAGSDQVVQVVCRDLICRKESRRVFFKNFPLTAGSTGITTDLYKLYCHHFRFQDPPINTIPQVKALIKAQELEDPIFETSQFIAMMTGVPDFWNSINNYQEMPLLVRGSIDERWTKWGTTALKSFSRDLFFEEALKIRVEPRRDPASLAEQGFGVDFSVTLGELDRVLLENDKLKLTFDLKLSKNYLRTIRTKWTLLENDVDIDGQKAYKEEIARYINHQLKEKEKLFSQKMWNENFGKLIAEELLQQMKTYKGSFFEGIDQQVITVPVKFSYGLFALNYLRYRADVNAGRFKLNL